MGKTLTQDSPSEWRKEGSQVTARAPIWVTLRRLMKMITVRSMSTSLVSSLWGKRRSAFLPEELLHVRAEGLVLRLTEPEARRLPPAEIGGEQL